MSKAIQERIFVEANMGTSRTSFFNVRYGNVVASRGSVVPLFEAQIAAGGPVSVTTPEMTRFLITLDGAVDTVFEALRTAKRGETYVPQLPAVRVLELAQVVVGDRDIEIQITGIRPGEKIHEIMVSEEERYRTIERGDHYVIEPMLPEVMEANIGEPALAGEYSSADSVVNADEIRRILERAGHLLRNSSS